MFSVNLPLNLSLPIVTDGSVSLELLRAGYSDSLSERYVLSAPVAVERVHAAFIEAGATLIRTHTQHANRYALSAASLTAKVQELNRKAVWIARSAAGNTAVVAGVIGPTGYLRQPLGPLTTDAIRLCFQECAKPLIDTGANVILLQGFVDVVELEVAIDAVRSISRAIPVIALKSFPEDAAVLASDFPVSMGRRLAAFQPSAIGSCGTVGPQRMLGIVQALRGCGMPLAAIPDVGIPSVVEGRAMYSADADHVARAIKPLVSYGASIVGVDGGGSVAHVKAVALAVRGMEVGTAPISVKPSPTVTLALNATTHTSTFAKALLSGKPVFTVELDVPRGLDMSSVIEGAGYLKQHGIDAVNISDGARARLRMSPITISHLVQQSTGMECITHMACRDRNMVGLQSELLGAHALSIRNVLAITGDPTHIGDFPSATSVYDFDSVGLIRALHSMNNGCDVVGNPLGQNTEFSISCAVNPVADDINREIDRLAQKVQEGATIAFTQPVFDAELLDDFLHRIKDIPVAVMLGVIPLRSLRHAEFLHYEVPGMVIPLWVREKLAAAGDDVNMSSTVGVDIGIDFLISVFSKVNGVYLMPPFKKYSVAVEIMNAVAPNSPLQP